MSPVPRGTPRDSSDPPARHACGLADSQGSSVRALGGGDQLFRGGLQRPACAVGYRAHRNELSRAHALSWRPGISDSRLLSATQILDPHSSIPVTLIAPGDLKRCGETHAAIEIHGPVGAQEPARHP